MTVARQMDVRDNIKKYFDIAYSGDVVFIPRKDNKNVYVISQKEYEELQKAKRNAEYLQMLERSRAQLEAGETVTFTMEELRKFEDE